MLDREVAWRVFAHEFNHSDYFFHEGDERSPNYLVTFTGAKVNRMYFSGVLTEIDNIGAGEDMWRARISDPTGGFTVYAGQYQPEAAVFLSGLEIPCFVSVVGKARAYEPESGTTYTSVRPEELNIADSTIRDRWIIDTARLTFERIEMVRIARNSGLAGDELIEMLKSSGASAELADGISRAVEHYRDIDAALKGLHCKVVDTLKTLLSADHPVLKQSPEENGKNTSQCRNTTILQTVPESMNTAAGPVFHKNLEDDDHTAQFTGAQQHRIKAQMGPDTNGPAGTEAEKPDTDEIIYELMGMLDKGRGVQFSELMKESEQCGLTELQVEDAIKVLMSEGRCYEPRIGVLRRV